MCGIAGFIDFSNEKSTLEKIEFAEKKAAYFKEGIKKRGPDSQSAFISTDGNLCLVHSLLAITEQVQNARQPMISVDKNFIIIYNGEIYNSDYLKKHFLPDFIFKTKSDTELVLELFSKYQEQILVELEGIFAFSIFEIKSQTLWLAKDHLGIKPLCYSWDKNILYFSSIAKLLKQDESNYEVNEETQAALKKFGFIIGPSTSFKNVKSLQAGHYIKFSSDKNFVEIPYFKINQIQTSNSYFLNSQNNNHSTEDILTNVIKSQMPESIPFGIFLSSGIDSNLIAAICKNLGRKFHTFTIGFENQDKRIFSESAKAKELANFWGSEHHEWIIKKEEVPALINEFKQSVDLPSSDGFNSFLAAKLAQPFCRVVFSGVGADELFLGYWHFEHLNNWLKLSRHKLLANFCYWTANLIGSVKLFKSILFRLKLFFLISGKSNRNRLEAYLFFRTKKDSNYELPKDQLLELEEVLNNQSLTFWQQISLAELLFYDQNQLLRDTDSASMFFGVEVRTPFLDRRMILAGLNKLGQINNSSDFYKFFGKQKLVKILKKHCPKYIVSKKQGFELPFALPVDFNLKN